MEDHSDHLAEIAPTYRSLFLGACVLISAGFGWWFSNFISDMQASQRAYEAYHRELEKRLADMEARAHHEVWEREAIQRDINTIMKQLEKH